MDQNVGGLIFKGKSPSDSLSSRIHKFIFIKKGAVRNGLLQRFSKPISIFAIPLAEEHDFSAVLLVRIKISLSISAALALLSLPVSVLTCGVSTAVTTGQEQCQEKFRVQCKCFLTLVTWLVGYVLQVSLLVQ